MSRHEDVPCCTGTAKPGCCPPATPEPCCGDEQDCGCR